MKILLTLLLLASTIVTRAAAPPVGSISRNVSFSVRDGGAFKRADLKAYEGKILVLMMMTPWCPICQSHASAVGDEILDYFNSPSRTTLQGKNAHGISIESVLLSTEVAPQWDRLNAQFAPQNGFKSWGLDAKTNRSKPRTLLGYFRGGFIKSSNLNNWGDDRRRVVVINLVKNSATHQYREIVINQNAFSSANAASAQAAINAIQPPQPPPLRLMPDAP